MRIALVHLCSFGDCLYATIVARQIKHDFPGCHLTWVIGSRYASILRCNPHVDHIHEIPVKGVEDAISSAWRTAKDWVQSQIDSRSFDRAFYTQILPDNLWLYDGLLRSTIYRAYPGTIRAPYRPILTLTSEEKAGAATFAEKHSLRDFVRVFLFECGPQSGQSPMTPQRAESLAHTLSSRHPTVAFCLSSATPLKNPTAQVIDASALSYRDNLALTHHCTGLIGASSGITWLSTSESGKTLPMLQVLADSPDSFIVASVAADFRKFGGDPSMVVEMNAPSDQRILDCVDTWILESHPAARMRFNEDLRAGRSQGQALYVAVRRRFGLVRAIGTLATFVRENGISAMPWRLLFTEPPSLICSLLRRLTPNRQAPTAGCVVSGVEIDPSSLTAAKHSTLQKPGCTNPD